MTPGLRVRPRSTSWHRLNADRPLRRPGRAVWSGVNLANNLLPLTACDRRIELRDFVVADVAAYVDRLPEGASPARALSDLFWMTLPWAELAAAIGPLHVLDIGCGNGYYGSRFREWSGGRVESYLGVDAVPRPSWERLSEDDPSTSYAVQDAEAVSVPGEVNLIVSQSCLEHVGEDLSFFSRVRDQLAERSSPWLQLHLVPAAACRALYGAHGVRQYTPRTISKATRLYPDSARFVLFRLGGNECARVHRTYITDTGPDRLALRHTSPERYEEAVRSAIETDMRRPGGDALFLGLAIASGSEIPL